MSGPRVGELFAGYGGIGLAVKELWPDAKTAWVSDVCKFDKDGNAGHFEPHRGPCRVLAHWFPDAPNLGDITKIDWSQVEPVDIITGGSPCQDLSHAGKRAGMKTGTRSGLWASMCDAIETLRPSLVIWENVRGALSAEATIGDVESCEFCVGDGDRPSMRALGRVLGDLADIGYDTQWIGLRAADVGACHGRFRVFVLAWPADTKSVGWDWRGYARGGRHGLADSGGGALVPTPQAHDARGGKTPEQVATMRAKGAGVKNLNEFVVNDLIPTPSVADTTGGHKYRSGARSGEMLLNGLVDMFPTPRASDGEHSGPNQRGSRGDLTVASAVAQLPTPRATRGSSATETVELLPTPAVNDMGDGKTLEWWDEWAPRQKSSTGSAAPHGKSLAIEGLRAANRAPLLPSPQTSDTNGAGDKPGEWADRWQLRDIVLDKVRAIWGDYAPAIMRHEQAFGRRAPAATLPTGRDGKAQLSPRFVEFMMGLPDGWITDVPGVTRTEALKLCGNGVVPAQCAEAVRWLLDARSANPGLATPQTTDPWANVPPTNEEPAPW